MSAAFPALADRLVKLANTDGEAQVHSRNWTGSLVLSTPGSTCRIDVMRGFFSVADVTSAPTTGINVTCEGTDAQWAAMLQHTPPPGLTDVFGGAFLGMNVNPRTLSADLHLTVRRLVELLRHLVNGTDPSPDVVHDAKPHGTFDAATGRYVHLDIDGTSHRVFFEEAGAGIGLLCQHTAGADARQWRHLLEDERITSRFRVIAYDLPHHGKSLPPSGTAWWAQEYRLRRDTLMKVPLTLARVLGLDRPAFIGSSVGGMLALDLARYHAKDFRAVIACEAALKLGASERTTHSDEPATGTDPAQHAAAMMSWMGATAPEAYRHETRLHYSQGAPGVFPGDIAYFSGEHDLRGEAHLIDTSTCAVHMLTGEYDFMTVEASRTAAEQIPGATYTLMTGLGHFPMSEDPKRFADYLLPLLDSIEGTLT